MEIKNQPNMSELTLTPAELELIKIKREQEALKAREAEAKKQKRFAEQIIKEQTRIAKLESTQNLQVAAAKRLAGELGADFTVKIQYSKNTAVVKDYDTDPATIVWSQEYTLPSARIVHSSGKYFVSVSEHVVYSSRWDSRGTSKGFKMYVSGPEIDWTQERRAYTRTSKVKEVIKTALQTAQDKIDLELKKKSAVETTVQLMNEKYPKATVEVGYDFTKVYGSKYQVGTKFDTVKVTLENGVAVKYRVYPDGQLGRLAIDFPKHDAWDLLDTLNQMNF